MGGDRRPHHVLDAGVREARGMMGEVASFAHLIAHPLDERGSGVLPGEKKAFKLVDTAANQSFVGGKTGHRGLQNAFRFRGGICVVDACFDDSRKLVFEYTLVEQ